MTAPSRRSAPRAPDPGTVPTIDLAIGGQAVIEGVMMRCPRSIATAVRTPNGRIVIRQRPYRSWWARFGINDWPLVRGGLHLAESMSLGIASLLFSAEQSIEDDELPEQPSRSSREQLALLGTLVVAFASSLLLFFWMPLVLTGWTGVQSGWAFNVIDGILRLAVFLLYILAISRMPDVRRLFQYHGAEHKTIHVFEAGLPLVADNARRFTTLHPRCGTSFLMFVMLVSVLVFMVLGKPESVGDRLLRLAFVPIIGGISYELIKLSGRRAAAAWMRPFVWPGLMLQKITTREPTDDQVEVAMAALRAALATSMETEAAEVAEQTLLELTQSAV